MNIIDILHQGQCTNTSYSKVTASVLEERFMQQNSFVDYDLVSSVVLSTIAIAMSSNGEFVATTHGDHTVKIFEYSRSSLLQIFRGHPRTPWTVKFHPTNSNYVASGCLGCEVRVWDIIGRCCKNTIRYDYSIISLAFQPYGCYIAVASGPELHMWRWNKQEDDALLNSEDMQKYPINDTILLLTHSRNIRAVLFHPHGKLALAAAPDPPRLNNPPSTPCRLYGFYCTPEFLKLCASSPAPHHLESMPALIPQVHLYSDGGIDISADGLYILTCAILRSIPANIKSPNEENVGNNSSSVPGSFFSLLIEETATSASSAFKKYVNPLFTSDDDGFDQSDESVFNLSALENSIEDLSSLKPPYFEATPKTIETIRGRSGPAMIYPYMRSNRRALGSQESSMAKESSQNLHPSGSDSMRQLQFADPRSHSELVEGWLTEDRLCLFHINFDEDNTNSNPDTTSRFSSSECMPHLQLVQSKSLTGTLMRAVTSVKLSPTGRYGLIGYGVRADGNVEHHSFRKAACEVINLDTMDSTCVMCDDIDEVNIAQFHPFPGNGIMYGTKRGKVRVFRHDHENN